MREMIIKWFVCIKNLVGALLEEIRVLKVTEKAEV